MNSLIEHIISLKDDREALTSIWCDFNTINRYPDSLPTQFKPDWWDTYPRNYKALDNYERLRMSENEGRKYGFGDVIMAYIETVIPKEELESKFAVWIRAQIEQQAATAPEMDCN